MIAALLFAPSPGGDAFCDALKDSIAQAPRGFPGVSPLLSGATVGGEGFACLVEDNPAGDETITAPHRDMVCKTALRQVRAGEAEDAQLSAVSAQVEKCIGPVTDKEHGLIETPGAWIGVTGVMASASSPTGPWPPPSISTSVTIHAKP
ncbi:MAG: hypothetical protein ACAH11_04310 [Sphingomonas sp.]